MSTRKKREWIKPEILALDLPPATAGGILGVCLNGDSAAGGPNQCETGSGATLACRQGISFGNFCGAGGNF